MVGEAAAIAQVREFWIDIIKKHASPDPAQSRGERKGTLQVGRGLTHIDVWSGSQRYPGTELNLDDPEYLRVVRGPVRDKWIERKVRWENIRLISFHCRCLLFNS